MSGSQYIMQDEREADRLISKVDCDKWVEQYISTYLSPEATVLDVGCGPGHLAGTVAQYVKQVIGVDLHAERFPHTQQISNLTLMQGDAKSLRFEDNKFDLSYMRFLLEYLPDKQKAINELVRVTKPGGIILVQDLDGQLVWHHPIADELQQLLNEAMVALESTGFDQYVGRKIFSLLSVANADDIQVKIEPYHLIAGTINDTQREQWVLKLGIAKKILTQLKTAKFADDVCDSFLNHLDSPHTLTYSNVFTVIGSPRINHT